MSFLILFFLFSLPVISYRLSAIVRILYLSIISHRLPAPSHTSLVPCRLGSQVSFLVLSSMHTIPDAIPHGFSLSSSISYSVTLSYLKLHALLYSHDNILRAPPRRKLIKSSFCSRLSFLPLRSAHYRAGAGRAPLPHTLSVVLSCGSAGTCGAWRCYSQRRLYLLHLNISGVH